MKATLKEKAKTIRKELKQRGIKASVRMSGGGAINIDLKDLTVNKEEVEEFAKQFESIRRCEATHEILEGGNDFIFVQYDWDILTEARDNYLDLAEQIIADRDPRYCPVIAEVEDKRFMFFPGNSQAMDALVMNTYERQREWQYAAYNKYALAEGLAIIDHRYNLGLLETIEV